MKNQLVSTDLHAADLEEWIAGYYRNNPQYEFGTAVTCVEQTICFICSGDRHCADPRTWPLTYKGS
ncbi:MAG: hypothetical protein ACLURV_08805 [Gallintestinimicrobium sp.]